MDKKNLPNLRGEPGWIALEYPESLKDKPSFVIGDPSKDRLAVRYFIRESDKRFFGKVFFGEATQGPPGHAHGGSMAAVLDEAMGFSAWIAGHTVVAAKITVEYLQMLPVNSTVTVEAWVESVDGRKVMTKGKIYSDDDVFSTSEGLFINIPAEKFGDASHYLYKVKGQGEK
ncbi:MAG: PaaI family thioesterase [Bacteroidetes bacterium]|nr:MAG: PaaI family thioesterase [Bacteroidota bacterium]RLD89116.1 MAG: PaaI family thioesterase [Bacteroidota bacterium]